MKKKNNWFKRILIILILLFISLYISSVSGYYEAKISDKVALTGKEIKQFEQDVMNGKEVDLNNYNNYDYVINNTTYDDLKNEVYKILEEVDYE